MANILKQYCDGFLYSGIACGREIESHDKDRCIGLGTESNIAFAVWDEMYAQQSVILHFHNISCAKGFLEHWLQQKQNPEEEPKEEPATETA